MFQRTVGRQYTQGLVGEIMNDGPLRASPAIITAVTGAFNRVGRAFGVVSDVGAMGQTNVAQENKVSVGGANFLGILGHPKHYTLYGNSVEGPLGASIDLPANTEGEFFDMAIMVAAVSNGADAEAAGGIPFNTPVFYCKEVAAATAGFVQTTAADLGRLYVFPGVADLTSVPESFERVPGGVTTTIISGAVPPATPNPAGQTPVDAGAVSVRLQMTK